MDKTGDGIGACSTKKLSVVALVNRCHGDLPKLEEFLEKSQAGTIVIAFLPEWLTFLVKRS